MFVKTETKFQKCCLLKMSMYLINVFKNSKDNDQITALLARSDKSPFLLKNVDF